MSGQPYRYASDPEKYRTQYMEELSRRTNLDDTVLQAVKNYVINGTIPPISQMPDTRTTAEKLLDIEKLKMSIVKELEKVTDYPTAVAMVQGLVNSPLNSGNKLITFMAQAGPSIIEALKKLYSQGIKGDTNDIAKFVEFINNAYSKRLEGQTTIKSLIEGGYNTTTPSKEDFDTYKKTIQAVLLKLRRIQAAPPVIEQLSEQLLDKISRLIETLPTQQGIENVNTYIRTISSDQDDPVILAGLTFLMQELPKKYFVNGLMVQIENASANLPQELSVVIQAIEKLDDLFPSVRLINETIGNSKFQNIAKRSTIYTQEQLPELGNNEQIRQYKTQLYRLQTEVLTNGWNDINVANINQLRNELGGIMGINPDSWLPKDATPDMLINPNISEAKKQEIYNSIIENMLSDITRSGNGIFRQPNRQRGRPRGSGIKLKPYQQLDPSKGIKPAPKFTEFGSYVLHNGKLRDGVLQLKTKQGTPIVGFPSQQMSAPMHRIINTIVGGGLPQYEDMSKLSQSERDYLHKVAKKANILDKLNIPAPDKTSEEKDLHQFEVMKGEIMSGNDSKELIKKFKLLLLRLSKSGRLPKAQVSEIMEDILSLGL